MISLNEFEKRIQDTFHFDDKSSRRMERVISDLTQLVGMEKQEILEFLTYGAVDELKDLEKNYNWNQFQNKVLKKLKP